ncbi:MAG: hypothetical protein FD174_4056 [Geobacteraceae bacterium]|nr:MAG: hypothetical protein FD174_4056 [Geobacteraceae bacterium]
MYEAVGNCREKNHQDHEMEAVRIKAVGHLFQQEIYTEEGKTVEPQVHTTETVQDEPQQKCKTSAAPDRPPEPQGYDDNNEEVGLERVRKVGGEKRYLQKKRNNDNQKNFYDLNHDSAA